MENTELNETIRKEGFTQVIVWPGTLVGIDKIKEFEDWFKTEFKFDCQYLEEIKTFPDRDNNGNLIENTGNRNDLIFAVNPKEMSTIFCIDRLQYGMRWIEDVLGSWNDSQHLYPERMKLYKTW